MKKLKFILLGLAGLSLFACNSGSDGTTNNNGTTITISNPNACKTITTGGSCSINVTYYANSANSSSIGQYLTLTLPDYYTSDITTQCSSGAGVISTVSKNCIITITAQANASVKQPQTGKLYPQNMPSNFTSFIVGGGL